MPRRRKAGWRRGSPCRVPGPRRRKRSGDRRRRRRRQKFRSGDDPFEAAIVAPMAGQPIAFGPFLLNPDNGTLLRDESWSPSAKAPCSSAPCCGCRQARTKAEPCGSAGCGDRGKQPLGRDPPRFARSSDPLPTAASGSRPSRGSATRRSPRQRRRCGRKHRPRLFQVGHPLACGSAISELERRSRAADYRRRRRGRHHHGAQRLHSRFAVVTRNSSFTFKGKTVHARHVGLELGVA